MSNKYFRDWEKTYSHDSIKSESTHRGILKKLEKDDSRTDKVLDRVLDKIETNAKAAKIFNQHNQANQLNQRSPIYSNIGFINIVHTQPIPVHITHLPSTKYVIINGCVVVCQNN